MVHSGNFTMSDDAESESCLDSGAALSDAMPSAYIEPPIVEGDERCLAMDVETGLVPVKMGVGEKVGENSTWQAHCASKKMFEECTTRFMSDEDDDGKDGIPYGVTEDSEISSESMESEESSIGCIMRQSECFPLKSILKNGSSSSISVDASEPEDSVGVTFSNTPDTCSPIVGEVKTNHLVKSQSEPRPPRSLDDEDTEVTAAAAVARAIFADRRVSFPVDEMLVTGYVEPPNPWEKSIGVTSSELLEAYREACQRQSALPIEKVLQQLEVMKHTEEREKCFDLSGETIDGNQVEALEEVFKRVQFDRLSLDGAVLDEESAVPLFDMMEYYETALKLDLSQSSGMSLRGWQACSRMIKKTHCLEQLNLTHMSIPENVASILARTFRSAASLTSLHLEDSNLTGRLFTMLMSAIKLNTSLQELYLSNNHLTSTDAMQLGHFLRANNRLKLLDLSKNVIGDNGIVHIAEGLTDQQTGPVCTFRTGLMTLILKNNHLSHLSTPHLARALLGCRSLEHLDLSCNSLSNDGIQCLKDALLRNSTLRTLSLQKCHITCEGAVALAEYIAENSSIESLDLQGNVIRLAGLLALTHNIRLSQTVTSLQVDPWCENTDDDDDKIPCEISPEEESSTSSGTSSSTTTSSASTSSSSSTFSTTSDSSESLPNDASPCCMGSGAAQLHRLQVKQLICQIEACCKRNRELTEKRIEDERERLGLNSSEVVSEPVSRLLSLWTSHPRSLSPSPSPSPTPASPAHGITDYSQENMAVNESPLQRIVKCKGSQELSPVSEISPASEQTPENNAWTPYVTVSQSVPVTSSTAITSSSMPNKARYCMKSPLPSPLASPVPSPTRSRFRVSRVFLDTDPNKCRRSAHAGKCRTWNHLPSSSGSESPTSPTSPMALVFPEPRPSDSNHTFKQVDLSTIPFIDSCNALEDPCRAKGRPTTLRCSELPAALPKVVNIATQLSPIINNKLHGLTSPKGKPANSGRFRFTVTPVWCTSGHSNGSSTAAQPTTTCDGPVVIPFVPPLTSPFYGHDGTKLTNNFKLHDKESSQGPREGVSSLVDRDSGIYLMDTSGEESDINFSGNSTCSSSTSLNSMTENSSRGSDSFGDNDKPAIRPNLIGTRFHIVKCPPKDDYDLPCAKKSENHVPNKTEESARLIGGRFKIVTLVPDDLDDNDEFFVPGINKSDKESGSAPNFAQDSDLQKSTDEISPTLSRRDSTDHESEKTVKPCDTGATKQMLRSSSICDKSSSDSGIGLSDEGNDEMCSAVQGSNKNCFTGVPSETIETESFIDLEPVTEDKFSSDADVEEQLMHQAVEEWMEGDTTTESKQLQWSEVQAPENEAEQEDESVSKNVGEERVTERETESEEGKSMTSTTSEQSDDETKVTFVIGSDNDDSDPEMEILSRNSDLNGNGANKSKEIDIPRDMQFVPVISSSEKTSSEETGGGFQGQESVDSAICFDLVDVDEANDAEPASENSENYDSFSLEVPVTDHPPSEKSPLKSGSRVRASAGYRVRFGPNVISSVHTISRSMSAPAIDLLTGDCNEIGLCPPSPTPSLPEEYSTSLLSDNMDLMMFSNNDVYSGISALSATTQGSQQNLESFQDVCNGAMESRNTTGNLSQPSTSADRQISELTGGMQVPSRRSRAVTISGSSAGSCDSGIPASPLCVSPTAFSLPNPYLARVPPLPPVSSSPFTTVTTSIPDMKVHHRADHHPPTQNTATVARSIIPVEPCTPDDAPSVLSVPAIPTAVVGTTTVASIVTTTASLVVPLSYYVTLPRPTSVYPPECCLKVGVTSFSSHSTPSTPICGRKEPRLQRQVVPEESIKGRHSSSTECLHRNVTKSEATTAFPFDFSSLPPTPCKEDSGFIQHTSPSLHRPKAPVPSPPEGAKSSPGHPDSFSPLSVDTDIPKKITFFTNLNVAVSANYSSLLEGLDLRSSVPLSPGQLAQSKGLVEMVADTRRRCSLDVSGSQAANSGLRQHSAVSTVPESGDQVDCSGGNGQYVST